MHIGVSAFLTEHSGEPGTIAQTAENLGFESFWVAEHLVIPASYTTYYPAHPTARCRTSTPIWPIRSWPWRRRLGVSGAR